MKGSSDQEVRSARGVFQELMRTDGIKGLTRGLSARITQSSFQSLVIILGYEYLKKFSVKDELRDTLYTETLNPL